MNQNKNEKPRKILFIEDDEQTIKTVKFILESENYEVSVAKDGEAAVRMLDNSADLILLDLVLPQKSGFDILKVIRQEKGLKIPVIILSNLAESMNIEKALKLGANDYIVKNEFPIQIIIDKIKSVLMPSPG